MSSFFDQDRREYVRVRADIPVRYKFLAKHIQDPKIEDIYQGVTNNISGGGILLCGVVPDIGWLSDLLMQRIVIGVNFVLPGDQEVIKALTRVSWIDAMDENSKKCQMGLKFKEVTSLDRDKIFKFIIRSQLPS
ncbi:MAG: PilZ domain-containing protein [Candidatus Brocadiia bacterium]